VIDRRAYEIAVIAPPARTPRLRQYLGGGQPRLAVPDELLAHVAPPGWEHVGLTGNYLWGDIDKPRERFRPLRLHQ